MRAVLALVLGVGTSGLVGCHTCVPQCAIPGEQVSFAVTPPMVVNGVQATLTGPVTVTMACAPRAPQTFCTWPLDSGVTAGSYSLRVSAPGHQETTVPAQVTQGPGECGCVAASLKPSAVALGPADAATD